MEEKLPLIICLQGHSKGFHISLGRPKYEGDEETINGGDRDFARQIIARGQAALAIEQRAFGERGGTPEPNCYQPSVQNFLLGRTIVGDVLQESGPDGMFPAADLSASLAARYSCISLSRRCFSFRAFRACGDSLGAVSVTEILSTFLVRLSSGKIWPYLASTMLPLLLPSYSLSISSSCSCSLRDRYS